MSFMKGAIQEARNILYAVRVFQIFCLNLNAISVHASLINITLHDITPWLIHCRF